MDNAITLRNVHFHGFLGEKYGKDFKLAVHSPASVIRLMAANFSDFVEVFRRGRYRIVLGTPNVDPDITLEQVPFNFPNKDIHFIPVAAGASSGGGKGLIRILLGVALIGVGLVGGGVFSGAGLSGLFGGGAAAAGGAAGGAAAATGLAAPAFLGLTWGNIALLGGAIALGGIAQLLMPTPKDTDKDRSSYFFNGAKNVVAEGGAIPLVYGRIRAGSTVVGASVLIEKLDPTSGSVISKNGED
jgi:predicted phage tail protein